VGHIDVIRIKFPVRWHLELFDEEVVQNDLHAGMTIQHAWQLLHNQVSRLYQYATFNYAGFLQPNLVVTAEVIREPVTLSFTFEVKDNGWITHGNNTGVSNMLTRQEIHAQISGIDPRIPPLAEYIEEDTRPYQNGDLISFKLKKFIQVTDWSDNAPGRCGGNNGLGIILPEIIYAAKPIDTTDPSDPKVQGSKRTSLGDQSALDQESESDSFPTDSEEDTGGYEHRIRRIAQAVHNHEPIMVIFVGQFEGYQGIIAQCEFRLDYSGPAPDTMQNFFEFNWGRIRDIAGLYGADTVPGSLTWTRNKITEENLDVSSYRFGKGLKVRFQPKDLGG
jgi:hypothetical protein